MHEIKTRKHFAIYMLKAYMLPTLAFVLDGGTTKVLTTTKNANVVEHLQGKNGKVKTLFSRDESIRTKRCQRNS